ncbi:MAG: cyclic nucleotide-binding domain-containing protein [Chloroflexota bacterium]
MTIPALDLPDLPIFANLDPETALALRNVMHELTLEAGEVLFEQGSPGDALYFIRSGRLCVVLSSEQGECCINQPGPGEHVGEMALLTGQPRSATVRAAEPARLLRLGKQDFERLGERCPALIDELARWLLPRYQKLQVSLALGRVFGGLDDETLEWLQPRLTWRRLGCGERLFEAGEPGDALYVVLQGRLRIDAPGGGLGQALPEVGAGEAVGEFALLAEPGSPESRRSAAVYAARQTDVVGLSRPVFDELLARRPQALLQLARRVIQRQRAIVQPAAVGLRGLVVCVLPLQPGLALDDLCLDLAEALRGRGPTWLVSAERVERSYGRPGVSTLPLDHPAGFLLDAWLDERIRQHQYVVFQADPPAGGEGLTDRSRRCIEGADVVLLAAEARARLPVGPLEKALATARTRARLELALLHPAGCRLPADTPGCLAPRRAAAYPPTAHHHLRAGHAGDLRRLARRLTGRPVGLALAGGGARGWAHVGVARALEEAHLEVDWVTGASMGSIIAAGLAMDWNADHLAGLAARFSDPRKLLDYTFPYASITATRRITGLLQELCGEAAVEDTWRPFFSVASNLTLGEEQSIFSGPLWFAIRASMAFPGVFAPLQQDGCVLIDGGAANNLPVDRMREVCGAGTVIGVNLVERSPVGRGYDFGPSLSGWQALAGRLLPAGQGPRAPTLFDIVNGIVFSNSRYRLNETRRCADLLIYVPVQDYGLLDFERYEAIIELGYQAAVAQLADFQIER